MPKRLLLVLLSAASLAGAGGLIARTLARVEGTTLGVSVAQLDADARAVERELAPEGATLSELAARIASQPGIDKELKQLGAAQRALARGPRATPAQKTRLESLRARLLQRFAPARASRSAIEAVALVSDLGEVLYSESARIPAGAHVGPMPTMDIGLDAGDAQSDGEPDQADAGADANAEAPRASAARGAAAIVADAYTAPARGAFAHDGAIYYVGAAAVVVKNRVAGIVVLERHLTALPASAPGAFLLADGKVILGTAPSGFVAPEVPPDRPFVLTARPSDRRPLFESALASAVVTAGSPAGAVQPGVWAARFRVPGVDGVDGFVTRELGSAYGQAADAQRTVFLGAALLWLLHASIIVALGLRVERAAARLSTAFAAAPRAGPQPALDERGYPRELRPLVAGLKALLARPGAAVAAGVGENAAGGAAGPTRAEDVPPVTGADGSPTPPPLATRAGRAGGVQTPAGVDQVGEAGTLALEATGSPDPAAGEALASADAAGVYGSFARDAGGPGSAVAPDSGSAGDPLAPYAAGAGSALAPDTTPGGDPLAPYAAGAGSALAPDTDPLAPYAAGADSAIALDTASGGAADEFSTSAAQDAVDLAAGAALVPDIPPARPPIPGPASAAGLEPPDAATRRAADLFGLDLEQSSGAAAPPLELDTDPAIPPAAEPLASDPATIDLDPAPAPDVAAVFDLAREVAERPVERAPAPRVSADALEPSDTAAAAAPLLTPIVPDAPQSVRALFDEFTRMRQSCGETGELTFEKFRGRVEESRSAVMARHHCSEVRFQVYVKNGRAAIKATPV